MCMMSYKLLSVIAAPQVSLYKQATSFQGVQHINRPLQTCMGTRVLVAKCSLNE